ncbi:hypothetical protein [Actinoplanes regularis]|uniref:hypothetical protein n=1 Tax=Actinoplanes regularis TaxID=52697 RepID=UPI0024A47A11|nr:hypothetical protein [Actinoplanes regularis]GLW29035.1 hypothetical protein Areg01_19750 [Actinoplanes regularis]
MNPVRFTIPVLLTAMLLPLSACEDQKRTETRSYDLSSTVTAIAVDGLAGRLDLSSGGGTIDATRIVSASLTARTGGGASVLDFAVPPGAVRTDSAGGDVTVRLPAERYAVDARSDGGDTRIEVTVDPGASHRIDVQAGGGDILVAPAVR